MQPLLQTRTTRRRSGAAAGSGSAAAHQEVPVEQAEGAPVETRPLEIEEVREGVEVEGGLMDTQELLAEAEGLLDEPLPPDTQASRMPRAICVLRALCMHSCLLVSRS